MEKINLFESRDMGRSFELSFSFLKQNYGAICKGILVFVPLLLLAAFFMPSQSDLNTSMSGVSSPLAMLSAMGGMWLTYFLIGIASLLSTTYTVCYMAEYAASEDGNITSGAVWNRVKKNILSLFITQILYGLAVGIGLMFCIAPGIFIAVSLMFYPFVIVVEGESVIDSLKRSYYIVQGNWWSTFGYGFLVVIVIYIVSMIFSIPSSLASLGSLFNSDLLKSDLYHYTTSLIAYVGQFFIAPIAYIAFGVLYFSLRNNEEGVDLETRIDGMGGDNGNYPKNY